MRKGSAAIVIAVMMLTGCGGDDDPTGEDRPEDIENIDADAAASVAPTATAVPVTVEPERLTYTVAEGDLMGTIAQQFDVPLGALTAVNNIDNPDFIQVGDELVIPTDDEVLEWEASAAAAAEAEAQATTAPEADAPAEGDGAESDGAESDGAEGDGAEGDGAEGDG